ncbi:unnamed protein product [Linum trigynum]|uniref:Uncharacterized protein n=1 Tax=Linum trigynum TaxID=586398 RepID=A0AAV2CW20_9ROSI
MTEEVPSPFVEPPSSFVEPTLASKGEAIEPTPMSGETPTPASVKKATPTSVEKATPVPVAAPVTYQRRIPVPSTASSAPTVEVVIEGDEGELTTLKWKRIDMKTPRFERSMRKPEVLSSYVLSNTVTCKLDPLHKAIVDFSLSTRDENE